MRSVSNGAHGALAILNRNASAQVDSVRGMKLHGCSGKGFVWSRIAAGPATIGRPLFRRSIGGIRANAIARS